MLQPGMCCRAPCGPCRDINFDVLDYKTGEKVGHIKKTWGGIMSDIVSDAGVYEVEFGRVQAPQYKGLLI